MRRVSAMVLVAFALLLAAPLCAATQWTRLATKDFELYTTAGEKQGRDTIRHFEQVREFFLQASPLRNTEGDFPVRIVQFATAAQYKPFRPNSTAISYFVATPAREYIVMGDEASGDSNRYDAAIHEYVHLIVRHSGLKLPTWLNEGWADVFSTLRSAKGGVAVGDLIPGRLQTLESEKWLDFDGLTSVDTSSPIYNEASRAGIFYAESWALAHMLFLSPEYKDNFGKFVVALNSGKSSAEACEMAFGRSSAMVFQDLRSYFDRKRLYGVVFETKTAGSDVEAAASPVSDFDSRLLLADLTAAIGRRDEAKKEYADLDREQPDNPAVAQSLGNLAWWDNDPASARQYFTKAFEEGSADPQLCYDLARLDDAAKEPPERIVPILERAVKAKPDFTEAKALLGVVQVETRDFPAAVATLMAIPDITPRQAPAVLCSLAYAQVQTGDLDRARRNAEGCRKWSKTEPDTRRAVRVLKFVEARSQPAAGVRPNEELRRATGVARAVECSPAGNRLQVVVENKPMEFDLPEPDAIELPAAHPGKFRFNCGALKPFRIGVEYAPPRSAIETSAGIVRRLEY